MTPNQAIAGFERPCRGVRVVTMSAFESGCRSSPDDGHWAGLVLPHTVSDQRCGSSMVAFFTS
jgi:hypothetical protein